MFKVKWKLLSFVWHFVTPWTVACQASLSKEYSRKEYWSGYVPFSRGSSQPGYWTQVSHMAGGFVTTESPGKPIVKFTMVLICCTTYQGYTLLGLPDRNRYCCLAEFSKLPRATHSVEESRWQEVGFQSPSMWSEEALYRASSNVLL